MGIAVIFYVFMLLLGSFALGAIVLAVTPGFRPTTPNLFVFVIGAILGIVGPVNLVVRKLIDFNTLTRMTTGQQNELTYALAFIGALIGGTILVWLKIRLLRAFDYLARSKKSSARK